MSSLLTSHLVKRGHLVRPCEKWTVEQLQQLQRRMFNNSEHELLAIYDAAGDNRRQRFDSMPALESHWAKINAMAGSLEGLHTVRPDGLCHEVVMAVAHHVSASFQRILVDEQQPLPSLPSNRHDKPRLPKKRLLRFVKL